MSAHPDDAKQGPANHGAVRHAGDLHAPTPPGGPLRQDQPGGSLPPTEDPVPDPEPEVQPSSTPDGPSVIPTPDAVPEPDPHQNPGGTADTGQALQLENAATSLDQPST